MDDLKFKIANLESKNSKDMFEGIVKVAYERNEFIINLVPYIHR